MNNPPRRSRPKKPGETIDSTAERIGTTPIVPETADAPGRGEPDEAALSDPETRLGDAAGDAPPRPEGVSVLGEPEPGDPNASAPTGEALRTDDPVTNQTPEAGFAADEGALRDETDKSGADFGESGTVFAADSPEAAKASEDADALSPVDRPANGTEAEFASGEGLDPHRKPDEAQNELDAETILAAAEPHHAEPPRPDLNYHETPGHHANHHGPGAGALVGSALLGAALALLAGGALQYAGVVPAVRQADTQQLAQQFARTGDVQQVTTDLNTVRGDVEQLKSTLSAGGVAGAGAASADLAALTDRVGALEGRVNNNQAPAAPTIDPAALNAANEAGTQAREAATRAQQTAEAAQGRADEARQTATTAQQAAGTAQQAADVAQNAARGAMDAANANRETIAAIESRIGTVEAANRQAAVAISAAGLKAAVDRGGPFMAELETYATAAGPSPAVDALRNYAPEGVPTLVELQASWPDARAAVLKALNPQDPNATVGSQILSGLSGLVAVRPSGQAASGNATGPEAGVARLDAALSAGNLPGWKAEWENLPQAAKDAGADFARRLDARAEAERVLGDALGQAVNTIGKAG